MYSPAGIVLLTRNVNHAVTAGDFYLDTGNISEGISSAKCAEAIYSNAYASFLVKYDGELFSVNERLRPECMNIINSRFLVAYRRIDTMNEGDFFRLGYSIAPKCYGLMDMSGVEATGADRIMNLPGLALTGKDVLIGFVDTGIDYMNPIFRNADGTTRIAAIWDQTEQVYGRGEAVFGYGAEFTAADIDRAIRSDRPEDIVPSYDEDGHGTFLASVAAGSREVAESFSGMAPEAGILMVKLKQAKQNLRDFYLIREGAICYGEDDIILGVKYLIDKAYALGKPLIICMGTGTSQGDHNGNTNLEQYFASLSSQRGICIVSPVGNELGYGGHYSGHNRISGPGFDVGPGSLYEDNMEIYVGPGERGFTMELWGRAPGLLRVSVLSPTGERLGDVPYNRDGVSQLRFLYEGTNVSVANLVVEGSSGDQLVFFRFDKPAEGIWSVQITEMTGVVGRGFDAWLPIRDFLSSETRFVRSDPYVTICAPGNSRGTVTVAGYDHYTNALYVNSGRGYTRLGSIKPDITAPAVGVYGAFAAGRGGRMLFTRRDGSSIASAFTAGAAALVMEWGIVRGNNQFLNTEIMRQMLIRGASESSDIEYPNRAWGWGVLDLYGTFETMRNV